MKIKYLISIAILAIISIAIFRTNFYTQDNVSTLSLKNIEALSETESEVTNLWCCGNTSDCVVGPNLVIKGKVQTSPCS